jgi:hypothetical protein
MALIVTPLVVSIGDDGGYLWFNANTPTATELGGVFAGGCPVGELAYGIFTNGSLACAVP